VGGKMANRNKKNKHEKKDLTIPARILLYLFTAAEFVPRPFESKAAYFKRVYLGHTSYQSYLNAFKYLEKNGYLKIFKDKENRFILLTKRGQLKILFLKADIKSNQKWDGKWRLVVFDIPEEARARRNELRRLLKQSGFKYLQASVFISPYSLNRDAIGYLKESGLIKFIRIMKVEEIDDDKDLKKAFCLA
jgi:CRISPR/Cas system-associated endoribonuclease Cas2